MSAKRALAALQQAADDLGPEPAAAPAGRHDEDARQLPRLRGLKVDDRRLDRFAGSEVGLGVEGCRCDRGVLARPSGALQPQ